MRKSLPYAAVLALFVFGACSDVDQAAGPHLSRSGPTVSSRVPEIDAMIMAFFPKGLETATGKRFDHIDATLGTWNGSAWSGDVAVARSQLAELADFIRMKARDIDPASLQPGETQDGAAARLSLAMLTYVHAGPDADPPTVPLGATDIVFDYVPAGTAALIQTPSRQAGLRLDEGSTAEDRIIVIALHPASSEYTERCSGPLPTDRCQYPPFYKFESYPHLRLQIPGRFAICHVQSSLGPTETEDEYIRLAHNLPADPANYTEGAIQEGQIEILPRAATQTGVVSCGQTTTASGVLGAGQRALRAVASLAEQLIAPRALHAYDQGPEHLSEFFSDFAGVGAPIVVGVWNGTTRIAGSTGTGQPVTVVINSQSDAGLVGEYRVAQAGPGPSYTAYNIRPGDGLGRFISSSSVNFNGTSFTIDPFYSPFSAGVKLEHTLTRTFNEDLVPVLSGMTVRTNLIGGVYSTDNWELKLTKAAVPLVGLPCIGCISLRAAPTGATASSTAGEQVQQ